MLLFVDDTLEFHKENLQKNYKHYSYWATRLSPKVTDSVNSTGSMIYFNPLIPLQTFGTVHKEDQRRVKYGVI